MVLNEPQRDYFAAEIMRLASATRQKLDVSKSDVRSAVAAADDWLEANFPSFVATLPASVQTTLTDKQKMRLLVALANFRHEVS